MRVLLSVLCLTSLLAALTGCAANRTSAPVDPATSSLQVPGLTALPHDGAQPWEHVDAQGHVVADPGDARQTSAFPASSEFAAGVERFSEGGDVSDNGEASRLTAAAGSGGVSYALYRFTLGGVQPSALAVDANLAQVGGQTSEYWVALSDYGHSRWEWHGPYSEAQVTLTLDGGGDYLSPLGNTFVAIAAYDGAQLDVVGVMVNPQDSADTTPPPAPGAPSLTPVLGGLEVSWPGVVAADLAGYRIYWSYSPFTTTTDNAVHLLPYLEGATLQYLPVPLHRTVWVGLTAVDVNGNASSLSPLASARGLLGTSSVSVSVCTPQPSALRGDVVTLTATGADSYDWDTDGDGTFDISGDPTGTATVDTSATGLIRPRVRGTSTDGTAVAFGSVSLIVTGNQRPVAAANVTPAFGYAPLLVNLNGEGQDFDGTIAEYAWDYDGDGTYDSTTQNDSHVYAAPGLYNAKLRVTDDQGAWDVDTIAVQVLTAGLAISASPLEPEQGDSVTLSLDPPTAPSLVEWDLDGNGTYEVNSGTVPNITYSADEPGYHLLGVRVSLASGGSPLVGQLRLLVRGWRQTLAVPGTSAFLIDLKEVNGNPAIAYYNSGGEVYYARALDPEGNSFAPPILLNGTAGGAAPRLLVVAGHPAVASIDPAGELLFVRSTDSNGAGWGTPVTVGTGATSMYDLQIINGRPAASFKNSTDDLLYIRANNASGSSWGSPVTLDTTGSTGYNNSLQVVNGNPAVIYTNFTSVNTLFIRANDADGSSWPASPVTAVTGSSGVGLQVVDGVPTTVYQYTSSTPYQLIVAKADNANGTSWSTLPLITLPYALTNISYAVAAGKPVVSWNQNRTFAFRALNDSGTIWEDSPEQSGYTSSTYSGSDGLADINGQIGYAYQANGIGLTFALRY